MTHDVIVNINLWLELTTAPCDASYFSLGSQHRESSLNIFDLSTIKLYKKDILPALIIERFLIKLMFIDGLGYETL